MFMRCFPPSESAIMDAATHFCRGVRNDAEVSVNHGATANRKITCRAGSLCELLLTSVLRLLCTLIANMAIRRCGEACRAAEKPHHPHMYTENRGGPSTPSALGISRAQAQNCEGSLCQGVVYSAMMRVRGAALVEDLVEKINEKPRPARHAHYCAGILASL
jgi:hypothetical protein